MRQRLLRLSVPLLTATVLLFTSVSAQAGAGPTLAQVDKGKLSLAGPGMTIHYKAVLGTPSENQALLVFGDSTRSLYVDQAHPAAEIKVLKRYYAGQLLTSLSQAIKADLAVGISYRGAESWFGLSRFSYRTTAHSSTFSFTVCRDLSQEKVVRHGVAHPVKGLYSALEVHSVEMMLTPGHSWKVIDQFPLYAAGPGECGRP